MAHHGDEPFDGFKKAFQQFGDRKELLRELLTTTGFRGALGEFPEGKLTPSDQGAIQFAIGSKRNKVVLDFGKQVHWVAMTPQQATELASALLKHARKVARKNGETVSLMIGS